MNDDEKLKNTEISFSGGEEQNGISNSLSLEQVNSIFLQENEMLLSIADYISPETKDIITDKISKENEILTGIANKEFRIQERINNETKPVIDDNYFNKKPLNINNI
ncbi:MAG: hypothetical protein WC839_00725 [Candidatus Paceibacterota bacterium]